METFCCPLEICRYILNKVELRRKSFLLFEVTFLATPFRILTPLENGVTGIGGGIEVIVENVGAGDGG